MAGSSLRDWTEPFFGGKVMSAVSFLLGGQKLSSEDVAELRRLVDQIAKEEGESR